MLPISFVLIAALASRDIVVFLDGKIARWWMPDHILFVESLPKTGTGKVLKNALREQYGNILISAAHG